MKKKVILSILFLGILMVVIGSNRKEEEQDISKEIEEPFAEYELFESENKRAEDLMQTMTLEEKVGQMFLVRFPEDDEIEEIKEYHPGGYILFGRDFEKESKESIRQKLEKCQEASKIKMIFGVDEEGGTVTRVSKYPAFCQEPFQSPQQLWESGGLKAILEDSEEKTRLLKSLGINMNLTPIADAPTQETSFIYERSYGKGAEQTAIYVANLIRKMNDDGMISVMKHFPGYGDNVDTHKEVAIDERPYETFEKSDFLPFIYGVEAKGPCILVSHNIVTSMDSEKPASLSKKVHQILREKLDFSGIILTDDLAMDAIKEYKGGENSATEAVLAGNDMIISSDFIEQKKEILEAIEHSKISEEQINQAVKRILALKYRYKII